MERHFYIPEIPVIFYAYISYVHMLHLPVLHLYCVSCTMHDSYLYYSTQKHKPLPSPGLFFYTGIKIRPQPYCSRTSYFIWKIRKAMMAANNRRDTMRIMAPSFTVFLRRTFLRRLRWGAGRWLVSGSLILPAMPFPCHRECGHAYDERSGPPFPLYYIRRGSLLYRVPVSALLSG